MKRTEDELRQTLESMRTFWHDEIQHAVKLEQSAYAEGFAVGVYTTVGEIQKLCGFVTEQLEGVGQ